MAIAIKVALLGATGESGGLILNGLLASNEPQFEVTALVRSSSIRKPETQKLVERGLNVVEIDLEGPEDNLAEALAGVDVVIVSIPPTVLDSQLPLARAAKRAGVKRFVPSAYAMAIATNSVSSVQNTLTPGGLAPPALICASKERIRLELEEMDLPYTIIDVGWWHHMFIPKLPSGQMDYAIVLGDFLVNTIPGDGNTKTCIVDTEDVGPLVARIIADPTTINKKVMACGEILTLNEIYDISEKVTGEKPERKYVSEEQLSSMMEGARLEVQNNPGDFRLQVMQFCLEYFYSSFIHGDNSAEGISRLGYVKAGDLHPDFKPAGFRQFLKDTLEKKRRIPYSKE